ncbi:hypothetical protein F5148DRAFT_1287215 [Russula earlei]|uniref:Uncharacterized protein n=1 Tax=Russula earlei TaxID=71964 RepID=A0ACC0U3S6_9AGAM|nr:hypothetical protein F5148DRAFT_1287215 [Russula earlei]
MTAPLRSLSGPHPGQLDQTQPSRVLRHPDAKLSFASFHPLTASNTHPYHARDCPSNPKRIVIESHPSGSSCWRFVPRARLAEGVSDEGPWPRPVDFLGNVVTCDEDQWDIHKLDPFYECFVPAPPQPPTIRAKVLSAPSFAWSSTSSRSSTFPDGSQKRRLSTPPSSLEEDNQHSPKKRRHVIHVVDSESDEDQLEIDTTLNYNAMRQPPRTHVPVRRVRERRGGGRRIFIPRATPVNVQDVQSQVPADENMQRTPPQTPTPPSPHKRRKCDEAVSPTMLDDDSRLTPFKRVRTRSPDSVRRGAAAKSKERVRTRTEEYMRRMNTERAARRDARDQALMEDIIAEMPEEYTRPSEEPGHDDGATVPEEADGLTEALDELRMHEERIAESRRKIAELERDRPLWEAAERARERQEREEEEERRAEHERRRRREEAEALARAERKRLEAERERQAEAEAAEAAKRRREAQRARWARGPWTSQRALERYRVLCESFDETAKPASLTFEDIPWPTLRAPFAFGPEDIDWSAVEAFFHTVRGHMRAQDYRAFVEKSHRRFHPDRWSARGLLAAIGDDDARGMIEVAANTVAQALTPLWREARGQ